MNEDVPQIEEILDWIEAQLVLCVSKKENPLYDYYKYHIEAFFDDFDQLIYSTFDFINEFGVISFFKAYVRFDKNDRQYLKQLLLILPVKLIKIGLTEAPIYII